eukprot:6775047-Prymnesium_polylepis.2
MQAHLAPCECRLPSGTADDEHTGTSLIKVVARGLRPIEYDVSVKRKKRHSHSSLDSTCKSCVPWMVVVPYFTAVQLHVELEGYKGGEIVG